MHKFFATRQKGHKNGSYYFVLNCPCFVKLYTVHIAIKGSYRSPFDRSNHAWQMQSKDLVIWSSIKSMPRSRIWVVCWNKKKVDMKWTYLLTGLAWLDVQAWTFNPTWSRCLLACWWPWPAARRGWTTCYRKKLYKLIQKQSVQPYKKEKHLHIANSIFL